VPFQRIRNLLFGRRDPPPRRGINMETVVLVGIIAIVLIFLVKRGKV